MNSLERVIIVAVVVVIVILVVALNVLSLSKLRTPLSIVPNHDHYHDHYNCQNIFFALELASNQSSFFKNCVYHVKYCNRENQQQ